MRRMIRNLAVLFRRGVIRWLLRDEFSDTRAAGAVNGTPCTPGPGTRTVVDTGSDLSIGSDVLNFSGGVVGWGDPALVYADIPIVRTAGRMMLCSVTPATINGFIWFGFNNDTTPAEPWSGANTIYVTSAARIWTYDGNSVHYSVTYAATTYIFAVVLRTAGAYFFVKGGAFTNWTLFDIWGVNVTTPVYAAIDFYDNVSTSGFIRVPDALWLPAPAAYDTFTRGDGALGSSDIWGPDNQIVTARAWSNRVGTTQIATNKASASALVGGVAIATMDTGTVNAITDATLTRAGNEVGVVLRYVDADNYIRAIHDGTNCKLVKRVAAAETDVISAVVALGAGAIRVIPDGTTFMLYLNNARVGAVSTINDAALQTGTEQGLFSTNVGNTQDLWSIFARGSNGEYAALNKWSF